MNDKRFSGRDEGEGHQGLGHYFTLPHVMSPNFRDVLSSSTLPHVALSPTRGHAFRLGLPHPRDQGERGRITSLTLAHPNPVIRVSAEVTMASPSMPSSPEAKLASCDAGG